jgi:hypothetical protein
MINFLLPDSKPIIMPLFWKNMLGLLLLFPALLWGQNRRANEDVVYLHNGSIIRGELIEQVVGEYVKIKVASGDEFTFSTQEIERITVEAPVYTHLKLTKLKHLQPITSREARLYHVVDWGLNFYDANWGPAASTALHYRLIYHQNHWLNYGLGTGWDLYAEGTITPIFAELQGDLWRKPVTPTYVVQMGYGFGVSRSNDHDVFDGGLNGMGALGVKFHTRSRTEISFTVGFKFQDTYQEFREWPWDWWNQPQGVVLEPVSVKGSRRYQRLHYQLSITL